MDSLVNTRQPGEASGFMVDLHVPAIDAATSISGTRLLEMLDALRLHRSAYAGRVVSRRAVRMAADAAATAAMGYRGSALAIKLRGHKLRALRRTHQGGGSFQ